MNIDDPDPDPVFSKLDGFAFSVASGFLSPDPNMDAAVGNPGGDYNGFSDAGEVRVMIWE